MARRKRDRGEEDRRCADIRGGDSRSRLRPIGGAKIEPTRDWPSLLLELLVIVPDLENWPAAGSPQPCQRVSVHPHAPSPRGFLASFAFPFSPSRSSSFPTLQPFDYLACDNV